MALAPCSLEVSMKGFALRGFIHILRVAMGTLLGSMLNWAWPMVVDSRAVARMAAEILNEGICGVFTLRSCRGSKRVDRITKICHC